MCDCSISWSYSYTFSLKLMRNADDVRAALNVGAGYRNVAWADTEGGHGVRTPPPPEKSQKWKITKSALNIGQPSTRQRNAI